MIVLVHGVGQYHVLGRSRDDALGEAFDKSAMIMGLAYPGGPIIEQLALTGNPQRFSLPTPLVGARNAADRQGCDFSFSGLKTAVVRLWQKHGNDEAKADLAAGLQHAVAKVLVDRLHNALQHCKVHYPERNLNVAFVGGVSANLFLRHAITTLCDKQSCQLYTVPLRWCTDNATMIGWAALERINNNMLPNTEHFTNRPRWSLEALA